ncbi:MAG: homocysteine S-methyltransferase family protein [Planctomyces sp.]|nr:homocysteine S-methyltransferase family protein [Planctomyces sp.]
MTALDRLRQGGVVLLDGATGTELERRGFALARPGWSARALVDAPELLAAIHRDYAEAGAEIITANTFRLHGSNLESWGRGGDQRKLVRLAVSIAREAAPGCLIAASLAPVADCYSPELAPDDGNLAREHQRTAETIAAAGADLILIETMTVARESIIAAAAARATGLPFVVSFVCGPDGRLLSGELLSDAARGVAAAEPLAIGVNCIAVEDVHAALDALRQAVPGMPLAVCPNTSERGADGVWRVTTAAEPAVYAALAKGWRTWGAGLIGGCCGTTPAHVAAMQQAFGKEVAALRSC